MSAAERDPTEALVEGRSPVRPWPTQHRPEVWLNRPMSHPSTLGRSTSPVLVSGVGRVVQVVTGGDHTCARDGGGRVRCWGADYGQGGIAGMRLVSAALEHLLQTTPVIARGASSRSAMASTRSVGEPVARRNSIQAEVSTSTVRSLAAHLVEVAYPSRAAEALG